MGMERGVEVKDTPGNERRRTESILLYITIACYENAERGREGERASSGKEENAGIEGEAIGGSYSTGRKGL